MRLLQACALSALIGGSALAGSIPFIAVVTHQRDRGKHEPDFSIAVPTNRSLVLFNPEGYRVAWCDQGDANQSLTHCHIEDGYDLSDVMNAWLKAYQDR